ncbi:hypothetical protein HYT59_00220 [Candidatus Woesebacteria bacterium]|nr:hypothetical protein [Candidatus Woesebacteria bacterium]
MFKDKKAIDLHVNVGDRVGDSYYDGAVDGENLRRQFSPVRLINTNLRKIGLRTHYSLVKIPGGYESMFIPSVSINWIGMNPVLVEEHLNHFSHPRPILWFQSFRDPYHKRVVDDKYRNSIAYSGEEAVTVTHTDDYGRLTINCMEVLEVARDKRAIIATPHSNWERTVPLIVNAIEMGLSVLWTHPDSRLIKTPIGIQRMLTGQYPGKLFVERAAVFIRDGKPGYYSPGQVVEDMRVMGSSHIIFTSDSGRYNPNDPLMPDEALLWYFDQLVNAGLTIEEAEMGLVINPSKLLEDQT